MARLPEQFCSFRSSGLWTILLAECLLSCAPRESNADTAQSGSLAVNLPGEEDSADTARASETGDSGCTPTTEVCDRLDNDCDGLTDEDLPVVTSFADTDGDGYGVGEPNTGCELPEGYSEQSGDCDDGTSTTNPGADEHCADGRDDNCNGQTDETCSGCTTTVPGTVATIQDAIAASIDGNVVCVAVGTYAENLDYLGKEITVLGVEGAERTVLDGGGWTVLLPVVTFTTGESEAAVLTGFTITNGVTYNLGGGIRIVGASPTLTDLIIRENTAADYYEVGGGGGIYAWGGAPVFRDLLIEENAGMDGTEGDDYGFGGGIMLDASSATLENVTLTGNRAGDGGGLYLRDSDAILSSVHITANSAGQTGGEGVAITGGSPRFMNVLIDSNYDHSYWRDPCGAGIWLGDGAPVFEQVVVVANLTDGEGGGLCVAGGSPSLTNSVVSGNTAGEGGEIVVQAGTVSSSHSNVWNATSPAWVGIADPTGQDGNLSVDPVWFDGAFHLDPASALVDGGMSSARDPDGSVSDIGIFGGSEAASWDLDGDSYALWWQPGAYTAAYGSDCDDGDAAIYPGAGC